MLIVSFFFACLCYSKCVLKCVRVEREFWLREWSLLLATVVSRRARVLHGQLGFCLFWDCRFLDSCLG